MSSIILHPTEPPRPGMVRQKTLFPITNKFAIRPPINLETFIPPFTQSYMPDYDDGFSVSLKPYHLVEWFVVYVSGAYRNPSVVGSRMYNRNWHNDLLPVRIAVSEFTPPSGRIPYDIISHNTAQVSSAVFGTINDVLVVPEHAATFSHQAYNLFLPFNGRLMNATSSLIGQHDFFCIVSGGAGIEYRAGASRLTALWVSTSFGWDMQWTYNDWFKIFTLTITPI